MAAKNLTREQMQAAVDAVAVHGDVSAAAAALGMSRNTLQSRVGRARAAGVKVAVKHSETYKGLKTQIRQLQDELKAAQKEAETAAAISEKVYGLASHTPQPPEWLSAGSASSGFRGAPMTLWSDWHYGEVVRKEEVGGVNRFNAAIAARRIEDLTNKTIELCFHHMGDATLDYPGIVVCLGGDMISGDIHEELAVTNDRTPYQAVNDLTDLIAAALLKLADAFGRVYVPGVVGNHGRGTHKPRMKGRVHTSFEWNIYKNLERFFSKDQRFSFYVAEETDAYFSVYGHRFLLTHGDSLGVKGGDGIIGALGPIMRGAIKVGRSEAQIGRDFDTILMGHWHQYITLPGLVVNGTLKGYDEFARLALRAPYSRPSQALWFVHPKHGITAQWPIYLEPLASAKTGKKWVEVLR